MDDDYRGDGLGELVLGSRKECLGGHKTHPYPHPRLGKSKNANRGVDFRTNTIDFFFRKPKPKTKHQTGNRKQYWNQITLE
jgi:hypothetical protein